uniref:Uncharacterized protein n=1 Tax=Thermofilum pendens TaxID=2269 RepID=A0A7C3SMA5_THEPE
MITFGRPEALLLLILGAVPVVLHRRASARRAAALRALGGQAAKARVEEPRLARHPAAPRPSRC